VARWNYNVKVFQEPIFSYCHWLLVFGFVGTVSLGCHSEHLPRVYNFPFAPFLFLYYLLYFRLHITWPKFRVNFRCTDCCAPSFALLAVSSVSSPVRFTLPVGHFNQPNSSAYDTVSFCFESLARLPTCATRISSTETVFALVLSYFRWVIGVLFHHFHSIGSHVRFQVGVICCPWWMIVYAV